MRGTVGQITSKAAWGAGAEWGVHGKWAGFVRYGAPGMRFAGRAVDEKAEEILILVGEGLEQVFEAYGWAT